MTTTLLAGSTGPRVSNTLTLLIGNRITVQTWEPDGTISLSFKYVNGPTIPGGSHMTPDAALAVAELEQFPIMAPQPSWMVS